MSFIRKHAIILAEENSPTEQLLERVIGTDAIPYFVRFLGRDENPSLQLEAVRVLTSIVKVGTIEQTEAVGAAGAIPLFVRLLSSPNEEIRILAVLALGYIAGSTTQYKEDVLQSGALSVLLQHFTERSSITTLRIVSFTISRLCRGRFDFNLIRPAIPLLTHLLYLKDTEIVNHACSALSEISNGPNDRIEAILQADENIVVRLIEILLGSTITEVQIAALKVIGSITTGDDDQTQRVIEALPSFVWLLDHPDLEIRKEVCWAISNITAGTTEQIQAVIDSAIFPKVLEQLRSEEFKLQKEAAWTVANAVSGGTSDQVWYLIHEGSMPLLCSFLHVYDAKFVLIILESLENMLRVGEETKRLETVIGILSDCDGKNEIEKLQYHDFPRISSLAEKIFTTYLR